MAAVTGDRGLYRNYQQQQQPPPASAYLAPSRYENYNLTDINKCVNSYYENQGTFYSENPPPYADSPGYYSGVDTLPTLPETPSETDELNGFGNGFDNRQHSQYYGVASVPIEGQESIGYYSPADNGVYYSANEEDLNGQSQYLRYLPVQNDQQKMGSGSSVASSSESQKQTQKQKKQRRSSSSSDNGGFESGPTKPVLGVKEKLRCSLDKIRPFRWNSSDKLSNNGSTSKSKTKNNRRYSDSGAAFLSVNLTDSNKKKPNSRSGSASTDINRTLDSNISSSSKKDKRSWKESLVKPYHSSRQSDIEKPTPNKNSHDYVNITAINPRQFLHPPAYKGNDHHTTKVERALNDYYIASPANSDNMPRSARLVEGKDTITRAKGTWNMLKTQKPKQVPIKASESYSSYATLLSASSDTLQSSDTVTDRSNVSTDNADPSIEPPKLAPVSGQLLMDKNRGNLIVRPTAFKPVVTSQTPNKTSPLMLDNKWEALKSQEAGAGRLSIENSHLSKEDRQSCMSSESNNSDSGRHSVTSISAGLGNNAGSSFSCSGSEGYESARVSSSTNHSAVQEGELNSSADNNNKSLGSDDVMLESLESRMKEKESEIRILRQSFEDNEKTLHKVYEDRHRTREAEFLEIKQKYSNQLKSQHRKSLQSQTKLEAQFRMLQEDQKRLIQTNKELQGRIQSMKDEIDLQSRQHEDIAELKARLEESEVELQQKHGEISHLKRQLKDRQAENSQRASEVIAIRGEKRDLCVQLAHRDNENAELNKLLNERNVEIAELERRLTGASRGSVSTNGSIGSPVHRANYSSDSSVFYENHQPQYHPQTSVNDYYRDDQNYLAPPSPQIKSRGLTSSASTMTSSERDELLRRLHEAESRSMSQAQQFQKERRQWTEDKNKVIRYQKQLQVNYVQAYKRSSVLEREVKMLTAQLQASGCEVPPLMRPSPGPQETERSNLCYPMEI